MDERRKKDRHQALGVLFLLLLFLAIGAAAFDPGQVTKSIGGHVLKATLWGQGNSQVVRVTYAGDTLPDSITVAMVIGPGDTTRAIYRKLNGDRVEFQIIETDPR